MPTATATACRNLGCPGLVRDGVCSACGPRRRAPATSDRGPGKTAERGYGGAWQRLRLRKLRQHPLCEECQSHGRITAATDVDHILPKAAGGSDEDGNLQCLCHECHSRKSRRERDFGMTGPIDAERKTYVTIICGPAGSGKTTAALKMMQPGDLIIDMDAIYSALSGMSLHEHPPGLLPFAASARDAVLARLRRQSDVQRAWIVTTEARADRRRELAERVGADAVYIYAVPYAVCMQRIAADPLRHRSMAAWHTLVERWWLDYRPNEGEIVIEKGEGG